ncbi:MAG: hypothetical protein WA888_10845 [Burkholderiaceae bacterium]
MRIYEALRNDALHGHARPDGLGAMAFHGMWRALSMLNGIDGEAAIELPAPQAPSPDVVTHDCQLVRVLANMVLATQSGARYVY